MARKGNKTGEWARRHMNDAYVKKAISQGYTVIAIDLLDMDPIDNVIFLQGDFQDETVLQQLDKILDGRAIDLVISDMAPNITGVRSVDEAQYEGLLDSVLYFCELRLKPNSHLLVKLFEGSAAHYFRREVKTRFKSGAVRKPKASRSKSREYYFLAKNRVS